MVFFICNSCGNTLKKNAVQNHSYACYSSQGLSCVDCNKVFGDDYAKHISCITENQKYGDSNKCPEQSKGQKKQELWMRNIKECINNNKNASRKGMNVLQTLVQSNMVVPQNEKKFKNLLVNNLRANLHDAEEAWTILKAFSARNDGENSDTKKPVDHNEVCKSNSTDTNIEPNKLHYVRDGSPEKMVKDQGLEVPRKKRKKSKYSTSDGLGESNVTDTNVEPDESHNLSEVSPEKRAEDQEFEVPIKKKKKSKYNTSDEKLSSHSINTDDQENDLKSNKSRDINFEETFTNDFIVNEKVAKKKKKHSDSDKDNNNETEKIESFVVSDKRQKSKIDMSDVKKAEEVSEISRENKTKRKRLEDVEECGLIDVSVRKKIVEVDSGNQPEEVGEFSRKNKKKRKHVDNVPAAECGEVDVSVGDIIVEVEGGSEKKRKSKHFESFVETRVIDITESGKAIRNVEMYSELCCRNEIVCCKLLKKCRHEENNMEESDVGCVAVKSDSEVRPNCPSKKKKRKSKHGETAEMNFVLGMTEVKEVNGSEMSEKLVVDMTEIKKVNRSKVCEEIDTTEIKEVNGSEVCQKEVEEIQVFSKKKVQKECNGIIENGSNKVVHEVNEDSECIDVLKKKRKRKSDKGMEQNGLVNGIQAEEINLSEIPKPKFGRRWSPEVLNSKETFKKRSTDAFDNAIEEVTITESSAKKKKRKHKDSSADFYLNGVGLGAVARTDDSEITEVSANKEIPKLQRKILKKIVQ